MCMHSSFTNGDISDIYIIIVWLQVFLPRLAQYSILLSNISNVTTEGLVRVVDTYKYEFTKKHRTTI